MTGKKRAIVSLICVLSLSSCTAQESVESSPDFYEGLKKRQEGTQAGAETFAHFEKALHSANTVIATAAADELMLLHSSGAVLPATTMARIREKASPAWARALAIPEMPNAREEALDLLLNSEHRLPGAAAQYLLQRWRSGTIANRAASRADGRAANYAFTAAENAAIDGRLAVSRLRYNEALLFFRIAINDSPELFFRYPELLNDLGRTFQYTSSGTEGMELFRQWEHNLDAMPEKIAPNNENLIRFRLSFYAARIARQRREAHMSLFEKALEYAPEISTEQVDACIWYMLDSALAQSTDTAISYLKTYISQWHDDSYYADVMDKLARTLILKKQWEQIVQVFALLKNRSDMITAQYAWIIGRAIAEGFFSARHINLAGALLPHLEYESNAIAKAYMRIAYTAQNALYYRAISAEKLGALFLELPKTAPAKPQDTHADGAAFLMGFFEHDAAEFAPRYIRAMEHDLSPDELRPIAAALNAAGQYQESMRLVSRYTMKDGYQAGNADLQLWYPQPYKELVEQYAEKTGIDPALLFALIRTESAFNHAIVSRTGAIGLTQLMPATAEEFAGRIRRQGGPDYTGNAAADSIAPEIDLAANLRDPQANIHIGTTYLAYLNGRMGDPLLALLAYNGGMNRVRRWHREANNSVGAVLPPDIFLETVEFAETRNYGRSVIAASAMYTALYY